ncbi:uncharacterized protein LOC106656016 [Trichogramma pretiosum]|uniref:Uncharacterized protein n=1 Tax=Trichogramma kaykai TaxID=54128 RepID=A0ABD2X9V7_9HYME|nr:uncharacterized protein LOC106656016 [Trichogramma pretiosum]
MVSKRIKYARAHLTRRRHIVILATPLWRRTPHAIDFNSLPRPFQVPRAALRARATKRIKMMAQPKYSRPKYDQNLSRMSLRARRGDSITMSPESTKRLFDLSLPKKSALMHARLYLVSLGNKAGLANVSAQLRGIRKSRYQKYRMICNSLHQRAVERERKIMRKMRRYLASTGDWERHKKALERLAQPKKLPRRPRSKPLASKKKPKPNMVRLQFLAKPARKQKPDGRDPFAVQPSALVYKITERMLKLADRENVRPEPEYLVPGAVNPNALKAEPTTRTLQLAKPAERPPGRETDLKEDAFSVPKSALKARCTPRLKKLAKPKTRYRPAKGK